jgi:hypothetical protein
MKITFNILFWKGFDFENRLRNLEFSWFRLKKFVSYLKEKGIESECLLFDFSEENILPESIHIPYPDGVYKRSEKINRVLIHNKETYNPEIICVLDSDIFFEEDQYDKFIQIIKDLKDKEVLIPNLSDIIDHNEVDFINKKINNPRTVNRGLGGLGAFFMLRFNELFNVGGFDERFTIWGGEDDNISIRLSNNGCSVDRIDIKLYHLPHQSMMPSAHKDSRYYEQIRLLNNQDIVTNSSLISKKYLNESHIY